MFPLRGWCAGVGETLSDGEESNPITLVSAFPAKLRINSAAVVIV